MSERLASSPFQIDVTRALVCALVFLVVGLPATASFGQLERYELGSRLRRFELAWESAAAERRRLSTPRMERAVSAFFSLRLSDAARHLDEAWLTTQTDHPLDTNTRWLVSHRIDCDTRLCDASSISLRVGLVPFYRVELEDRPSPTLQLTLYLGEDEDPRETQIAWSELEDGFEWEHGMLEPGDYRLSVSVVNEDRPDLEIGNVMVSYCEHIEERLQESREAIRMIGDSGTPTGIATVNSICDQLDALLKGTVPEADFPAERRLQFCEELIAVRCESNERLNIAHPGDYFVTLELDGARLPVRLNVPTIGAGHDLENDTPQESQPVLIAFHGAGGSENMFFETYGAGRLVDLAEERGWLVVSPRQALFGLRLNVSEILQVLSEHFEIDRERVYLVGHSMGAGQVVSQCERHGEMVAKAVAIGGGRAPRKIEPLKQSDWLVVAGERDFGRRGATALARRLREADATVTYREFADVEHMVIVQAALDAVFRFLDGDLE